MLWRVHNAAVLVVCEGPFDAFRITTFGHKFGVYGTCLFGLNVSDTQAGLLEDLSDWFNKIILLLDPEEAGLTQLRLLDQLNRVPISTSGLPKGVKDPGELSAEAASALIQSWLT
jgi:DNA primase